MGWAGKTRTDEDEICAMYMRNLLEHRKTDHKAVKNMILASSHAAKFDDIELQLADVNVDGNIDVIDIVLLVNIILAN